MAPAGTGSTLRVAPLVLAGAIALIAGPTQAATFFDHLGGTTRIKPFSDALAHAIVRAAPLAAASSGVEYEYDDTNATFDRTLFGQVFLERPSVIGQYNWSVASSYQWVSLRALDGKDLDALRDVRPPICEHPGGCTGRPYRIPAYHLELDTSQVTTSLTVGLPCNTEVALTVPVLVSELDGRVVLRDVRSGKAFIDESPHGDAFGVGDVLLRAKRSMIDSEMIDLALGLLLRLPSGDEQNLQGTGGVGVSPAAYASTNLLGRHMGLLFRPFVNLALDLDTDVVERSEVRWGVGLDARRGRRFTMAVAFLARHQLQPFGEPGALDFARCVDTLEKCQGLERPLQTAPAPLFGIASGRRDLYDLSVGGRVALFDRRMIVTLAAVVPLNDEGVRPEVAPTIGIEVPFVEPPYATEPGT